MNRTKLAVAVVCSLLLSTLTPPSRAQGLSAEEPNSVRLTLQECLRTALENNLDLVSARQDPRLKALNVTFADAAFDPVLGADIEHAESKSQPSNLAAASKSLNETVGISWTDPLKIGGSYSVGLGSSLVDSTSAFNLYNPSYQSGLSLTWKLPLLKGFGREVNTQDILVAKNDLQISEEELRRQATAVLRQVEDAYWNLAASRAAYDVAKESLKLAQDLYELNKKKVEVGTLAPIEITQAEAGVASREEGIIRAENAVRNSEDELRRLLAIPKVDPMWTQPINPLDRPSFTNPRFSVETVLAKALERRPEILAAQKSLETAHLNERVAKKGVRHQLDLTVSGTPSGTNLKETVCTRYNPLDPTECIDTGFITGGLGTSLSQITDLNNYRWSVGLTYAYPVANRAAKASFAFAEISRAKSEVALQNTEQSIRVDVRTTIRNVESGAKRVEAARSNTVLQRKTVEAEQKKFENGMSTSFEVLRIQSDLLNAQLAEIQAMLDYTRSLSEVSRAQGTLLEDRGLQIDESAGK